MKPTLFLLCGLPASGKTEYSKKLEKDKRAVRFTLDEQLFKRFGRDFPSEYYSQYEKETKEALMPETIQNIKNGHSVIPDYGFWKKKDRDLYKSIGEKHGAEVELIYFNVPIDTLKQRLKKRNTNNLDTNHYIPDDLLDSFVKQFEVPNQEGETRIMITTQG